jgi:hypothetical protein
MNSEYVFLECACAILPSVAYLALQYFSTLSHKRHDFRKKIEHKMFVLIFSTTFVYNVAHSMKTWARYTCDEKKCVLAFMWSTRYSCPILMQLKFSQQFSKNKRTISWISVPWAKTFRAEGRTDRHDAAFRNFVNESNNPQDWKPKPSEYKTGMSPTWPRCSVLF